MKKLCAALLLALPSMSLLAAPAASSVEPKLAQQLAELGLKPTSVANAPVPGLLQVFTDRGLFFASADGQYLIQGEVFDLKNKVHVNEEVMKPMRLAGVKQMAASAIEFKAKNEKFAVTVFTDTDCGYCRKLHSEMQDYLDAGITVRYLAYPRGGENSQTFSTLESIWCSKDKQGAMNKAKSGSEVSVAKCDTNVAAQYHLGQSFGISGTPALVLPDGSLIPGYQPAAALAAALTQLAKR
jgi:thiol:disulfide interchange protein DsbC